MTSRIQRSKYFYFLFSFILAVSILLSCSDNGENPLVGPINGDDVTPPAKPSLPSLTSVGNAEIHISWTANSEDDLAGYKLYRAENQDLPENYVAIFDSTVTEFQDKFLEYETTYFYRVSAYDKSTNESELSNPVAGTPRNITPPASPQNVSVFAQNIVEPIFQIIWDKNTESDLSGYKVYRGFTIDFLTNTVTFLDSTVNNFYTDTNVFADTVYYYKITAVDKGGMESILPSFPESDVALLSPTLVSPLNGQTVSPTPTLTWNQVNNTNMYKVFIQTTIQGGEIWNQTVDKTQNSVTYNGSTALETGRLYFWKVATISKDSVALNSFSITASFRIQ